MVTPQRPRAAGSLQRSAVSLIAAMGIDARDTSEQNIASGNGGAVVQEVSALIRIDGTWKNGDLFTVPRSKLPAIDSLDDLSALAKRSRARDFWQYRRVQRTAYV